MLKAEIEKEPFIKIMVLVNFSNYLFICQASLVLYIKAKGRLKHRS